WMIGAWIELPVWQLLLALAGLFAASGLTVHLLAFHSPASEWTRSFRGIVPPFSASVVLIFSFLLGFIAGEVSHRNTEALQVVRAEAEALFALAHLSRETDPAGTTVQGLIRAYAQSLVREEWPKMQEGKHS